MSFSIIPKSPFPDVPNLPGVPLLARAALTTIVDVTSALNIARVLMPQAPVEILQQAVRAAPIWGVFDSDFNQVIAADSVLTFDYRADYAVSTYPVQQGTFASYNKVSKPFDAAVQLTKGGSVGDRAAFLAQCAATAASLNLYQILTPEKTYLNCNVTRMETSRKEAKGAYFVIVELYFIQVKEVSPQYSAAGTQGTDTSNAQSPAATPPVNNGNLQALPPTPQTSTVVASKLTTGM